MPPACGSSLERLATGFFGCVRRGQCRRGPRSDPRTDPNWQALAGAGQYENEDGVKLMYVGEGKGSYSMEDLLPPPPPAPSADSGPKLNATAICVLCVVFFFVGAGFVCLVWSLTTAGPPDQDTARLRSDIQRQSSAAEAASGAPLFMCDGSAEAQIAWSAERRKWCCDRRGVSCAQ
mmetsp:Transcript_22266/g.63699  ORF Transcript_22266/g.63699 Transcript_22266/m.63699 type:complete len:177 (-) Transcript_22266:249-779(-)